ncbi:unnamed protein product [Rodentolepis nana]|uniref:Endo/exonuclease/phosphatase domain-containing protein n=1 Tax=Rodentolepis nana TaxID=102285 RepID=A0A0R3TN00_RODNA|nr:unnamed protein product [Rodentolepis nana]
MISLNQSYKRNCPRQGESQRLQILQWNVGGMSQDKKIQVQKILQTYDVDIFTIMEANLSDVKLNYYQFPGYTLWGYKDTNIAGKEIEDMLNSNPLELIYTNEDPATYQHYNGTRTIPDFLLASSDISEHTHRKITDDPGSGLDSQTF